MIRFVLVVMILVASPMTLAYSEIGPCETDFECEVLTDSLEE